MNIEIIRNLETNMYEVREHIDACDGWIVLAAFRALADDNEWVAWLEERGCIERELAERRIRAGA